MFKNLKNTNSGDNYEIARQVPLAEGECGGCGITENVSDNTCDDCSLFYLDELTPSEQDAIDALEYANNWIW